MTLQLRKKRQTTRPSIQPTIRPQSVGRSAFRVRSFFVIGATLLIFSVGEYASAERTTSGLRWGQPRSIKRAVAQATQTRPVRRDAQVISTAWETEEQNGANRFLNQHRSIVVERDSPVYGMPATDPPSYDPFDEDDRLAQLPNDPFDDPFDEPVEEAFDDSEAIDVPEENIEDIEAAVEQEIQRRRTVDDLMGDELEQSLEVETPEEDPSYDEMDDEDPLSDDPDDEEIVQPEREDWTTPEFDLVSPEDRELTPEELRERSEERQREREDSEDNCREEIEKIEADTISSIDLSIRVLGNAGEDYPYECSVSTGSHQPRQWCGITYNWKASAICHKPLYFEQVQLERYGHSWGPYVQPIMSGVHFFSSVPLLPYKMGIRTPTECVYTLGYYRPGSCAPYMIDPIPFTWRAAMFEGAVATGIPLIVP